MITKAFILGAGLGTRLRPLTDVLPKPLVPIFHEPMANYALRHCQAAGIKEFAINTHHIPEAWSAGLPGWHIQWLTAEFLSRAGATRNRRRHPQHRLLYRG